LGCEGRIEESQGVLKLCDQLKDERTALQEVAGGSLEIWSSSFRDLVLRIV